MTNRITAAIATGFLVIALTSTALAQTTNVPDHPQVNEVNDRLTNQQNRINAGEANGTVTGKQAARDEARDAKVDQQLSADEAKNGGHITKKEQVKLKRELNHNSADIHRQKANDTAKAATAPAATPTAPAAQ